MCQPSLQKEALAGGVHDRHDPNRVPFGLIDNTIAFMRYEFAGAWNLAWLAIFGNTASLATASMNS
jgi:hypothetical protein